MKEVCPYCGSTNYDKSDDYNRKAMIGQLVDFGISVVAKLAFGKNINTYSEGLITNEYYCRSCKKKFRDPKTI